MLLYRVASHSPSPRKQQKSLSEQIWTWCSDVFMSPSMVLKFLGDSDFIDTMLIFFSTEKDVDWNMMLQRYNAGEVTYTVTVNQFLRARDVTPVEIKRLNMELSVNIAQDQPYIFTLPTAVNEIRLWTTLMRKVRQHKLAC